MPDIVSFEQALSIVAAHAASQPAPAAERVDLLQSLGRVLAEEILADRDQPPFDRATRDGFAVDAVSWSTGIRHRVVGQVRAGASWPGESLTPGSAIEIMTGAPVPPGASAVVMVEHVEQAGGIVWPTADRPVQPGDNIVPRGREAHQGAIVVPARTTIGAAEIAEAASCGLAVLSVHRRPTVAIIATGDELVGLEQTPAAHQIRNSNTYGLSALAIAAGASPHPLGPARDNRSDLHERIVEAGAADLLLLSGGVSAGKYDLVEEVLSDLHAEFLFTGVLMQPGKPLVFGRLARSQSPSGGHQREQYFFGLPGNPVSTEVTFHCFVQPFLRALCGAPWAGPHFVQASLAEAVAAKSGLTRVLPARIQSDLLEPFVNLVLWQGSGDLAANARANCYAVLPDGRELKSGDRITVLLR